MSESTNVGFLIQSEMSKRGWSLRDVTERAAKLSRPFSYEHLRKIISGQTVPSLDMLQRIARVLQLDPEKLTKAQVEATVTRRFGSEYLDTLDIAPEMYEMSKLMKLLTPTQRSSVIMMIRSLVQGNASTGSLDQAARAPRRRRRTA